MHRVRVRSHVGVLRHTPARQAREDGRQAAQIFLSTGNMLLEFELCFELAIYHDVNVTVTLLY